MTFLDEVPLKWSRPEVVELRDLFVLAYRRESAARDLADSAEIVPGMFPEEDNMRLTWTALLNEMARQGKVRRLVETARDDPTVSAFRERFGQMLAGDPPVQASAPPLDASWKGDDADEAVGRTLYYERLLEKRSRLLHVEVARRVAELARSVAKLEMDFSGGDRTHGTGFLIQPDLLLTNHHNLVAPKLGTLVSATADFDDERGFVGDHLVVRGRVETVQGDATHDWAVIQLENAVDRPPIALGSPFDVNLNEALIIIQHPMGAQKQFALDALAVRDVNDDVVLYVADTQKGSSGSPVFSARMHVVALHHAEVEAEVELDELNEDGKRKKEVVWRNEGINIKRVVQALTNATIAFIPQPV